MRWLFSLVCLSVKAFAGEAMEGTQALTVSGDLSVQMVEGIDRWLDRETGKVGQERQAAWKRLVADGKDYGAIREVLRKMIGATDARRPGTLEIIERPNERNADTRPGEVTVHRVRWPVFDGVYGEGLLLRPPDEAKAAVIALPDADQTPEQLAGLAAGLQPTLQFARRLAEQGVLVVVPTLVDRGNAWSGNERTARMTGIPHREWIYRQSFELGRTVLGFEVQKVFAAIEAIERSSILPKDSRIGVAGWGEGGLVALYAAALEPKIRASWIAGCLYREEHRWKLPIDRNLFGHSRQFDVTVLLGMAANTVIEDIPGPRVTLPREMPAKLQRGAPGTLSEESELRPPLANEESVGLERVVYAAPHEGKEIVGERGTAVGKLGEMLGFPVRGPATIASSWKVDAKEITERQRRTVLELQEHAQKLFRESERHRKTQALWTKIKAGAEWVDVQKAARAEFWEKYIGKLSTDYLPANPRTRLIEKREKWRSYEVMLDVHQDVFAWGILLVPNDLKPGERRPLVVCQHGLEGVPADTITEDRNTSAWKAYKSFAAQLAERGFIVYAPHNPYRGGDKFRFLQRKANPLGLSLFSFIIAQHDVTTRWLGSLPFVDAERIGFYGLSYGGKTAMRVPAVLDRYALSICSGDFNEWVLKCVSNTHPSGYIFTPEWEIWEWDLGHTFNYAEMALLIAPRPFMVERGHEDSVGLDEHVGYEWAKVLRGYTNLGLAERAEIEWFDGPHTIYGVGTFKFLHQWLKWPERRE